MNRAKAYYDRQNGQVWRNVRDPCDNCSELIDVNGGEKAKFDKKSNMAPMVVSTVEDAHSVSKGTTNSSLSFYMSKGTTDDSSGPSAP